MTYSDQHAAGTGSVNSILRPHTSPVIAVWQIQEMADFSDLMQTPAAEAARSGLRVVYIRFADHAPVFSPGMEGIEVCSASLSHRFENFTVNICRMIREAGEGCFFIFDSLSALQTAWATDLMMANFFLVTTPVLTAMKSSAHFPLLRSHHSLSAIEKIKGKADLFLDVFSDFKNIYVQPVKLFDLSAPDLFQPHLYDAASFLTPITDGVLLSHFHRTHDRQFTRRQQQNMDSWERYFDFAQRKYEYGEDLTEECRTMCDVMVTRDRRMRELVKTYFTAEDYFFINEHMIGTGLIGGKACGMLTARKIIEARHPDLFEQLESQDSFFIGSDVYYTYIVENDFWDIRVRQRNNEEDYFRMGAVLEEKLRTGVFSDELREQFDRLLEYYGQSPFIVRSSSLLEDGYDNAFAGKYESVFCPNTGTYEERMQELEDAVRTVYASSMSLSALDYRKRRGLSERDEQMSLLVMRVSGSRYGNYFMPCAAGVGYSYSPYRFLPSLDPTAGMLRLVMGLGTAAVDRVKDSYPRLVSLDAPELSIHTTVSDRHRYSQRNIDLIDLEKRILTSCSLDTVLHVLPFYMKRLLLEHDTDVEYALRDRGIDRDIYFISCKKLVSNEHLMKAFHDIMATLQEVYHNPVDIEYTVNCAENGDYVINLLQCRPLLVTHNDAAVSIPEQARASLPLFECRSASMGLSKVVDLDYIVYIDPIAYYNMPYNDKSRIASAVGEISWHFRGSGKNILLFTPGRICTSSPELGVPTTFADISEFCAICEVAETRAGYRPELSYGSHIFQDLVEADILYMAAFEGETTIHFHPELLAGQHDIAPDICKDIESVRNILSLYDVSGMGCRIYHDMTREQTLCTWGISEFDSLFTR